MHILTYGDCTVSQPNFLYTAVYARTKVASIVCVPVIEGAHQCAASHAGGARATIRARDLDCGGRPRCHRLRAYAGSQPRAVSGGAVGEPASALGRRCHLTSPHRCLEAHGVCLPVKDVKKNQYVDIAAPLDAGRRYQTLEHWVTVHSRGVRRHERG